MFRSDETLCNGRKDLKNRIWQVSCLVRRGGEEISCMWKSGLGEGSEEGDSMGNS